MFYIHCRVSHLLCRRIVQVAHWLYKQSPSHCQLSPSGQTSQEWRIPPPKPKHMLSFWNKSLSRVAVMNPDSHRGEAGYLQVAFSGLHVLSKRQTVHPCLSQLCNRHHQHNSGFKKLLLFTFNCVSLCVQPVEVHTSQGVSYLLVCFPQSQHDGGLGEHSGVDLFSVLQDTQRLVKVRSGVTHMPGNRWQRKSFRLKIH